MGRFLQNSLNTTALSASFLLILGCSGSGDPRGAALRSGGGGSHPGAYLAGAPRYHYPNVGRGSHLLRGAPNPSSPGEASGRTVVVSQAVPQKAPASLYAEVRVSKDYLPRSAKGRRGQRSMKPRYITIHSTQNWSKGADPWRHSLALKRSKLGKLSWHYTIDEKLAVQHLPTNITGRHADFDGPGNRYSIGIEMCEHPGNSRTRTVDRTAKLAAYLMYKHSIPLSKVVPHYHWPRYGMNPPHKNCPHFLLDNGRPGRKWRGFQARVKKYYDQITVRGAAYASR